MSKKLLWLIVILASIALLGLIAIQIYWTKNAFELKAEQFNQNVNSALSHIVKRIEYEEAYNAISSNINSNYKKQNLFIKNKNGKIRFNYQVFSDSSTLNSELFELNKDYSIKNSSLQIEDSSSYTDYEISVKSKTAPNNAINRSQSEDYIPLEVNEDYTLAEQRKLNQFFSKVDFIEDIVNKLLNLSRPIKRRISPTVLDSIISKTLKSQGIHTEYAFSLYILNKGMYIPKGGNYVFKEEMQNANYILNKSFSIELFPNDLSPNTSYLLLDFPNQTNYLFTNMFKIMISSILFLLLIIGSFYYAISTILKQKKLSEMKTDFINNMTHELKTPISTITLASEALSEPSIVSHEEKHSRFVNVIKEENERLNQQVQRVLQIAQLDKGSFKLDMSEVSMHSILNDAISKIRLQVEAKSGNVKTNFKASNDLVKGDAIHLKNLVYNLLDNANKYARDKPLISVTSENKLNKLIIAVSDNGIGMNKQTQQRIFEKFYRLPTGNIHNVKGFGLGLSYVKKILDMHEGKISVKSELGKGTTFTIFLNTNSNAQ